MLLQLWRRHTWLVGKDLTMLFPFVPPPSLYPPITAPPLLPPTHAKRASVNPVANPFSTPQLRLKASSGRFLLLWVSQRWQSFRSPGITLYVVLYSTLPPPGSLPSPPDMAVYTLAILCSLMETVRERASKQGALVTSTSYTSLSSWVQLGKDNKLTTEWVKDLVSKGHLCWEANWW